MIDSPSTRLSQSFKVNIRLPITYPVSTDAQRVKSLVAQQKKFLYSKLMSDYATQAPGFVHNGQWWVRFSAQIYISLEQFEKVARDLKEVCQRIERGEHLQ